MDAFFSIFEFIGIIASAVSGALQGIKYKMDLFGVVVLSIITALGGGLIRDIVIGYIPPAMFRNPLLVCAAIITALIVFTIAYITYGRRSERYAVAEEWVLFASDTVGLAAYTVIGIEAAVRAGQGGFGLLLFVGVITGTGGGMLRDILCCRIPYIFRKHVYAVASAAGAIAYILIMRVSSPKLAMPIGFVVIIIIRTFAKLFKWNMPVVGRNRKPEADNEVGN